MARKSQKESVLVLTVDTCGNCAKAYGYCCPGYDGSPIACRCPGHPERYLMCSEIACLQFEKRLGVIPSKVTEKWSENKEAHLVKEKVVPLFRPGEKEPWKVVPVSQIPPGGLLCSDFEE